MRIISVLLVLVSFQPNAQISFASQLNSLIKDAGNSFQTSLLGSQYQLNQLKIAVWNPANYGWKLSNGNIWVDVTVYPSPTNSKYCLISFSVTHLKNR